MAVTAHLEIEVSKLQLLQLKKEASEKPVKKSEEGEIRENYTNLYDCRINFLNCVTWIEHC